jgi:indole-3-pyruvate monooxygenase
MSVDAAVEQTDAIIVGAGPSGLAVGGALAKAGVKSILLERDQTIGPAWRRHYDRLHLHTPKFQSELPHMKYPAAYPRYPSRQQVVDYLESYAEHFKLDVRCGEEVLSAERIGDHWQVTTSRGRYEAKALIVATGRNDTPNMPVYDDMDRYGGMMLHSSAYRNGDAFKGQDVLVVGFGNSGGEIAIDLWERGAKASMSVRSAVNIIPRELLGIPIVTVARWVDFLPPSVVDLTMKPILAITARGVYSRGLQHQGYGPGTQIKQTARIPLIDVGTVKLIREGHVKVYPGIARLTEGGAVFVDGSEAAFDAIVMATGYTHRLEFLRVPEAAGWQSDPFSIPQKGAEASVPGLYFCGFNVAVTGMLREISIEARNIAKSVADAHA